MQAIVTKYLGPTNTKGGRIKARCDAGSLTIGFHDGDGREDPHDRAARLLAEKLGWTSDLYGQLAVGELPDGTGNAYVFIPRRGDYRITVGKPQT